MALHLLDANALFVHIPKTGGIWLEEALPACGIRTAQPETRDGVSWRHPLPADICGHYDFTFTFVRHPLSWYESWWKFQGGHWYTFEPGVWHPQRVLEPCGADDFSSFMRRCLEREPGYVTRLYEWYIGPPGIERVDFVGRQEALVDNLVGVLRGLNCDFDETVLREHPRANVGTEDGGPPVWDPAVKERTEALEAGAIRRFYGEPESPLVESEPAR